MGAELGRISGPLLSADLLRNGVDLAFETDLLYLDVNNGRIGVRTDAPTRPLLVNDTINTTNLIADTSVTVDDFIFSTNRIQHQNGIIYISPNPALDPKILTTKVGTLNLRVSDQLIENITNNSNIELSPNGSGLVNFYSDTVNVNGDLHATGNITWDGDVVIGNADTDNVIFNSDINSNIVPDITDTYDLGTSLKRWNKLYVDNVEADSINMSGVTVNNIDLLTLTGNTIYVSTNGFDTNVGEHYSNPVRTIKHALSIASPNDEIIIFPGTYVEEFPLTVPQGVSVRGTGIRSVTIEPTVGTNNKDCFLLNGDSTVQYLTIQNFFHDSVNNTGYAFRFANNFKTVLRSPYIYNVTVITKGSVTSLADPLGFNQGDAGGGAYLDGSVADSTSTVPPTGLFFATTFITPNQDGITALNGVRVEWLNSFTYYAKRGIYLKQGSLGRASQGTIFGAEMRSINSANVYGTYGAVADGADTLGYLIGHNFGYIGSGANTLNDRTTVVQANEVVELNNGEIYYDSMDHKGDYRVGDIFYVNQETGEVSFDAQSIDLGAQGNITLESPTSTTVINKDYVQTGNIRFAGNTILSLAGPVNVSAFSGSTYLNTDVFVTGNTSITGNTIVKGTVYLGNNPLDLITIAPDLTQNIVPKTTNTYTLGTDNGIDPKRWDDLFTGRLDIDGVTEIDSNTIKTIAANTDLIINAGGTGIVEITASDVEITQNLKVSTTTNLVDTNIGTVLTPADIVQIGDTNQVGNTLRTGDTNMSGYLDVSGSTSEIQLEDISIIDNVITTTDSNNDLILSATGSLVKVLDSDVEITNNLDVFGVGNFNSIVGVDTVVADDFTISSVYINDNYITTLGVDQNLILQANGTGKVLVPTNDVDVANNLTITDQLTVSGTTNLKNTEINDTTTIIGDIDQTGNLYIIGDFNNNNIKIVSPSYFEVPNIRIEGTVIRTTSLNTDLNFSAAGTGGVSFAKQLKITNNVISNIFDTNDIALSFNNLLSTEDGQLLLTENGDFYLADLKGDRDLSIIFEPNGTGNAIINSNKAIAIPYGNNSNALLESVGEIRQNSTTKRYEGWTPFGVVSFTDIYDTDGNTFIRAEEYPGFNNNILEFSVNGSLRATISSTSVNSNTLQADNVRISSSTISNAVPANNLEITSNGTGTVNINSVLFKDSTIENTTNDPFVLASTGPGYVKFSGTGAVVFPSGTELERRLLPELGELRFNSDRGLMEIYDGTGWISTSGASSAATEEEIQAETNLWAFILG